MQPSELTIVGIAAGLVHHLTLQGLTAIKEANVIVLDMGVDAEICSLWSSQKKTIVRMPHRDSSQIEIESMEVASLIHTGLKVVRLSWDQANSKKRLDHELKFMRKLGIHLRVVPSVFALQQEAWDLRLPWLSEILPSQFRIVQSLEVEGDRFYWKQLADGAETLALDLGQARLQPFIDRLLLAGADPERPVALVAHNPTQSPSCWLTTLEEVDDLLPQWNPQAATIVYIGNWPHAVRDSEPNKSFWGSLEVAAQSWMRAQEA